MLFYTTKIRVFAFLLVAYVTGMNLNAQPKISSFTPVSGEIGTSVLIAGSGFNLTRSNNIVFFGAVEATVLSSTSTSLQVIVPSGATYHPITVTDLSTNLTAISSGVFNVTFPYCGVFDTSCFVQSPDIPTDKHTYKISASDFNSDGQPDLLLSQIGGLISLYSNTSYPGNITFGNPTDFLSADYPVDFTISDFNGDGRQDFALVHQYNNQISLYKNTSADGIIDFAPKINISVADEPRNVTSGDIDGDGKTDLVVTYWYVGTTSVLLNTSTADSISFAEIINIADSGAGYISIFDYDGDGKPDIAKTKIMENCVAVYANTSTIGAVSLDFVGNYPTGLNPWDIFSSDLNGDGLFEIVTVNEGFPYSLSIIKNISTPNNISFLPVMDIVSEGFIFEASSADIDGNGQPDIAFCNSTESYIGILLNTSTSDEISFASAVELHTSNSPNTLFLADLDRDGKSDIVNCFYDMPFSISIHRNNAIPQPPNICMVTVDSSSRNNLIYWDKTQYNSYDSIIVYRETTSAVFKRIGSVGFDSQNFFIDTVRQQYFPYTGDPNIGSYRYKLQVLDTCGVYSNLGPYHNTIFISHNGSIFSWNHYEIEGEITPIPQLFAYLLFRDNYADGNWSLVGGVSGSQLSINDPDYDLFPNALSRVETQWSINCYNEKALNASSSNIIGLPVIGVDENNGFDSNIIDVCPNPFTTETVIKSKVPLDNATLLLFTLHGQQIMKVDHINGHTISLHRNNLKSGLYFVKLFHKEGLIAQEWLLVSD